MFRKRKVFVGLMVIVLLCPLFVSVGFAVETLIYDNTLYFNSYGLGTVQGSAVGEIISGNDEYVSRIQVYMTNTTSAIPSGYLQAGVFNVSAGSVVNDQEPLAVSDRVSAALWVEGWQWHEFVFDDTFYLNSSFSYCFAVFVNATLSVNVNYAYSVGGDGRWRDTNGPFPPDAWTELVSGALLLRVYTESVFGGGEGGDDGEGGVVWDGGSVDVVINRLVNWFVALALLLIPAFILGVWLKGGKWGFLIGMAIGSGLGYMLLPSVVPLWLVFLVMLGIIGMAYQSIRGA